MYEGYIYCITNKVNGKKYVGQTKTDIPTRWRGHKSDVTNPKAQKFAIHLAMQKYGIDNFNIQQIEKLENFTPEELSSLLNDKEIFYIKSFQTLAPNGYNLTEGGEPGNIESKKVCQYNTFGSFINEYPSITEAALLSNGNPKAISACCMHHLKTSGGFVWEYKGNKPRIIHNKKNSFYKVDQYLMNGTFIKTYENANIASKNTGIPVCQIRSVCNGENKTAHGYVWRKHKEVFNKYNVLPKVRNIGHSINQYDFEGNLIYTYDEYTKLPDYVLNQHIVYDCCRGDCKYVYGYIWTFDDDTPNLKDIPDSQRPLYQYDLSGNYIGKFSNVYEASEILAIDKYGILNCIQGRNDSANGFMWSIVYNDNLQPYKVKQARGVDKYDYEGNFIKKYDSIKSATEHSSIIKDRKSIENCCKGKIEYTRDGIWRYEGEAFKKYPLHKYCIINNRGEIIYSSFFQKDLAAYLNVDFRLISALIKSQKSYNGLYFKIIDINEKSA